MSDIRKNEGIIMSGGNINADQLAVGKSASIQKIISTGTTSLEEKGLQEMLVKLNELIEKIKSQENELENSEELLGTTEVIASELSKEKPNKLTITTLLDGIESSFGTLTVIASSAKKLKDIVLTLL